jgi:tRNA G26 N,N-dimethylase Trm1
MQKTFATSTRLKLHSHSQKKLIGMLQSIINEDSFGQIPLSFNYHKMAKFIRAPNCSKKKMMAGLKSLGQRMV